MLTYDVDVWSIRKRAGRPKPWELRWRVGERPHSRSFKLKPQADGRRAELMAALRDQQQFDEETGLPASELAARNSPSWYEHATTYVLMKWPQAAAKHRASIAESLAVVTPALVTTRRGAPSAVILRTALYQWAFRAVRSSDGPWVSRHMVEEPPADIRSALEWIASHSIKVKALEDPALLRPALEALSLRLDGRKAAENTARRKRMVLSNVLRYTVEEKGLLTANPFLAWTGLHPRATTRSTSDTCRIRFWHGRCSVLCATPGPGASTFTRSSGACTTPRCVRARSSRSKSRTAPCRPTPGRP